MKTTTTNTTNTTDRNRRRRAAAIIALLLLLALGVGVIYLHDQRKLKNGMDTEPVAVNTEVPVTTPTPVAEPATPVVTPADNTITERRPVARTTRKHRSTRTKRATVPADDQIGVATTETYGGNLAPAAPSASTEAAITPAPAPKVVAKVKTETKAPETVAKSRKQHGVNIAPEVGGNLNGFYNNNTSNLLTNGFHAGVMVNIAMGDRVALQPAARYIMKGNETKSNATMEGLEVNTTSKMRLHYAEMPVNLVYKFGDTKGNPRFMVGAGPYVGYLVDAKNTIKEENKNSEGFAVGNSKSSSKPNLNKFDAGVGGFIGCQMPKGFYGKAGAEVGLMDIQKNPATGQQSDRNFNLLISVGYIIGPKNKDY